MAASGAVGAGFIGTGMISDTYLENLTTFPDVRVVILVISTSNERGLRPRNTTCHSGGRATTS